MPTVKDFALAIQKHEGWYDGSRSFRNNNPGNLVYNSYTIDLGASRVEDKGRFAYFDTYEQGLNALMQHITYAATDELRSYHAEMTLLEFFSKYAPSADGNNPKNYATDVANQLGVTIDFKIKDFLQIHITKNTMRYHRFGHLNDVTVNVGDRVGYMDLIGHVGTTGNSTSAHLHYDVFKKEPESMTEYVIGKPKQYVTDKYTTPYEFIDKAKGVPTQFHHIGYDWLEKAKYGSGVAFHSGVDINGPGSGNADLGNEVGSPVEGVVVHVSKDNSYNSGWGNMIVIRELSEEETTVQDSPVTAHDAPGEVYEVKPREVDLQPVFTKSKAVTDVMSVGITRGIIGMLAGTSIAEMAGFQDAVVALSGALATVLLYVLEYLRRKAVQKYKVMR